MQQELDIMQWACEARAWSPNFQVRKPVPGQPVIIAAPRVLADAFSDACLSTRERERVAGLFSPEDRQRALLAHGLKRQVLSRLLGCSPESVDIRYQARGKPFVPGTDIRFNLSHSGDWVVLGLATGHALGVDVEAAPPSQLMPLARWLFHPEEYRQWLEAGCPGDCLPAYWVMKEALVKAIGSGVTLPFYTLRLLYRDGYHRCLCRQGYWYQWHRALDDDAVLGLATDMPLDSVRLITLDERVGG